MSRPAPLQADERGEEMAGKRIVVIDDDFAIRLSCEQALTKSGYEVTSYEDGAGGLKGVADVKPELVVVDLKMAGISGLEVIERVHAMDPNIVIVVITGYATIGTAVDAMKAGAYDFLPKPFKPDELRIIVRRALERRRLLLDARRAEMERELMKRRFITFVSHQLKSPLAAIHQYLDVLMRMEATGHEVADRKKWLERCLERTSETRAIIDDWLTLATIEKGRLARENVPVNLKSVVSSVMKSYEATARNEGVLLHLDMPDADYDAVGDRTCFTVLFENLIANAIKYNKRGGSVTVSGVQDPGGLMISVSDSGVGVSEEDLPFLFEEFFRGKSHGPTKTSGTGLGLAICKRIATEMGGNIEVESKAGIGSTFRVRLPAATQTREGGSNATERGIDVAGQSADRR